MYEVGQNIVYGSVGVCRVEAVSVPSFCMPGADKPYYMLRPKNQAGTIFVPIDADVFMRPVISSAEAERLIDGIPNVSAEAYQNAVTQELTRHYKAALDTHDCAVLLELTMSIYKKKQLRKRQSRKFGAVDEAFMKRAEALLFSELATALDMEEADVPGLIAARVRRIAKAKKRG